MQRHFYRNDDADMEEVEGAILRDEYPLEEKAEEGSVAMPQVIVADPAMVRNFVGHRRWITYEDTSEDANQVIFSGFVWTQKIKRGFDEKTNEPLGRSWQLSLVDMNTLWGNRVLVGSDCKRPAETDVQRMQWLVATSEMGYFDDLTLLSTANPVQMDKADYRGQMVNQVADDCAQQSGKNWWIGCHGTVDDAPNTSDNFVWYGRDNLGTYTSPLSLSNDPSDWLDAELRDGSSLVWPIDDDTELERNPDRQFSGGYLTYEKGSVYRLRTASLAAFSLSGRDMILPAITVKTKAKAIARVLRTLEDVKDQDQRITGAVTLPAAKATQFRAGMRLPYKAVHQPGFETFQDIRLVSATPKQQDAASRYRIGFVGVPLGATPVTSCSTVIAAAQVATDEAGSSTSPSVGITIADDAVLIAWLIGNNGNVPAATDMGTISGYTSLVTDNAMSRSTFRIAAKAASAGTHTASSTFTSGFGTNDVWVGIQVALGIPSATPVQAKYVEAASEVTLDSTPTPGNIILLFALADSGVTAIGPNTDITQGPTTGWTELVNEAAPVVDNSGFRAAIYARCVESGETGHYAFAPTGGYISGRCIYAVELAP